MRKLLILLLAVSSTFACAIMSNFGRQVTSLDPGNGDVTLDELNASLIDFSSGFTVLLTEAADRISIETASPRVRRLTLLWKIRMPPLAQEASSDPNPRTGYVEMLTVTVAQRQYLEDGAGKSIFGPQQSIALDAAREIENNALRLGESFLAIDKLDALHAEVAALAKEHPIRGEFLRESIQAGLSKAETVGAFDDIISIPMAPFRAIAGVESGAQAIHEFNNTAAQFTEIIDQLPQRLRWQMELLSYDLQEQGGALEQSQKSFDMVAQSADRLSLAAERAPQDMHDTIVSISTELEQRSVTLKALLAEYRSAMTDTSTTATNVNGLVEALARTSEQLNQAGVAWNALMTQVKAPSPPFNILDYEKTAIAIRSTAEEVRALLGDVEKVKTGVSVDFTDRILRNGIILIVVFFAALLGYRLISSRIPPSR